MEHLVKVSVSRYHEKIAGNFLGDWVKKHFSIPSKEKAIKILKKHIKSENDLDETLKAMPKMVTFLKSKKAEDIRVPSERLFPKGFVKNLIVILAMISILGNMYSKEKTMDKLKEYDVIQEKRIDIEDKYMGQFSIDKNSLKEIKTHLSLEEMNTEIIKGIKEKIKNLEGPKIQNVHKVKYPLEIKFTLDRAGVKILFPKKIKNLKDGDKVYVHRAYSPKRVEEIEKNLKKMKNEKS